MMILHLRNLDESSLASKIYKEQLEKGWPGLAREGKEICEELEIENVNETKMGKNDFKRLVNNSIKIYHEKMLREQAQEKTKCSHIMKDGYGKKDYMNTDVIEKVRQIFRSRVGLLPFAGNYSNDKKYLKTNWLCRCGEKETESHITTGACPIYEDIWESKGDVKNDDDLLKFFSAVLERRGLLDRLEEQEREAPSPGSGESFYC